MERQGGGRHTGRLGVGPTMGIHLGPMIECKVAKLHAKQLPRLKEGDVHKCWLPANDVINGLRKPIIYTNVKWIENFRSNCYVHSQDTCTSFFKKVHCMSV